MTGFNSKRKAARTLKSQQMTDWFPFEITPVRVGVYPVRQDKYEDVHFSKWDGEKWCVICDTVEEAAIQIFRSWPMYINPHPQWKGFKNEQ